MNSLRNAIQDALKARESAKSSGAKTKASSGDTRSARPVAKAAGNAPPSGGPSTRVDPPKGRLDVGSDAACLIRPFATVPAKLLPDVESAGESQQCHGDAVVDDREVVIGLDFGTSSTKVVINDPALGHAFAVPFTSGASLQRYLLPSRLCQRGDVFSLDDGAVVHRDLKLAFLAHPDDDVNRARLVGFVALVLRRARGWLFENQSALFKRTRIFWKLAIGLPTASCLESTFSEKLRHLA